MELQGHWEPGVTQGLTPDQKVGELPRLVPVPGRHGQQGPPGSMLGGGDGFACSYKAPEPACAQFLQYLDGPVMQRRIGSTNFGLPVRKGTESSVRTRTSAKS